jgi:hypothetical protein
MKDTDSVLAYSIHQREPRPFMRKRNRPVSRRKTTHPLILAARLRWKLRFFSSSSIEFKSSCILSKASSSKRFEFPTTRRAEDPDMAPEQAANGVTAKTATCATKPIFYQPAEVESACVNNPASPTKTTTHLKTPSLLSLVTLGSSKPRNAKAVLTSVRIDGRIHIAA